MADEKPDLIPLHTSVHHRYRGWTVLDFLADRFPYLDRELWENRLASGRIRLNGSVVDNAAVVGTGDDVEYTIEIVEPAVDFSYEIVHEDDDLLVVSKSGNLPVHASGKFIRNTLIARLREGLGSNLNLAHRIDRETSGLVVLTRNKDAARAMGAAFAEGRVEKHYVAIVRGEPERATFSVDAPLGRIGKRHPVPRSIVDRKHGKPARTLFRLREKIGGVSVVEATPLTGRTNQVRAHLEYAGHPVIGDKTYGMPARLLREFLEDPGAPRVREHLILPRHALHHARIRFLHPASGTPIGLTASLPPDMADFIEARRRA